MTDKELRKLSRTELLEMLVKLSEESETLNREKLDLQKQLEEKTLRVQKAGSVAEAALQVNGVFEAAQKAAEQYLENIRRLSDGAQSEADALLAETQKKCEEMEAAARQAADTQWAVLKSRLDQYCQAHEGLREQLGMLQLGSRYETCRKG